MEEKIGICQRCGQFKKIHHKGMCRYCYYQSHPEWGRMIICPGCKQNKKHCSKGFCGSCYNKRLLANHPELRKRMNDRNKWRYHNDPKYREMLKRHNREYMRDPAHRQKLNEYSRRYYKEHPGNRFPMTKCGWICECGALNREALKGRYPSKRHHTLCWNCKIDQKKTKVRFRRDTGEIIKILKTQR